MHFTFFIRLLHICSKWVPRYWKYWNISLMCLRHILSRSLVCILRFNSVNITNWCQVYSPLYTLGAPLAVFLMLFVCLFDLISSGSGKNDNLWKSLGDIVVNRTPRELLNGLPLNSHHYTPSVFPKIVPANKVHNQESNGSFSFLYF